MQSKIGTLATDKIKPTKASGGAFSQTTWSKGHEYLWKHYGRDIRSRLNANECVDYSSIRRRSCANIGTKRHSAQTVDIAAIVDKAAAAKGEKLAWRTSIVDLMKALNLDSSLTARKELAKELHYTGDTNDSATMNVWLHKQVMQKLAENGGKVPDDLRT